MRSTSLSSRLGLLLGVLLLAACPARAGIAFESGTGKVTCASGVTSCAIDTSFSAALGTVYQFFITLSVRDTSVSISSISGDLCASSGSGWSQVAKNSNGTTIQELLWTCKLTGTGNLDGSATVNFSAATGGKGAMADVIYSGVVAIGINTSLTGSSTGPTIALTTQDNNNWVVAGFAWQGTATASASVGNLRNSIESSGQGATSNAGAGGNDNTAATPSSVTNTITLSTSEVWAAVAVELRTSSAVNCSPTGMLMGEERC